MPGAGLLTMPEGVWLFACTLWCEVDMLAAVDRSGQLEGAVVVDNSYIRS